MSLQHDLNIFQGFNAEIGALTNPGPHREHVNVLQEILDNIEEIDFRSIAELNPDEKVSQKIQIVLTVQAVLQVARELNCGLCRNYDFIYVYNGEYWKLLDKNAFEDFLGKAAKKAGVHFVTAKYHRYKKELYNQFLADAYLPTPSIDKSRVLINLRDCTYEVTVDGGRCTPFDRSDFLKYQLPFGYDEGATCPNWQKFLDRVLVKHNESGKTVPDHAKQNLLAEFFGYVLAQHLQFEKVLILYGSGANGKSVVFHVISAMIGPTNISNVSLESLCKSDYHRSTLGNKLLNYSSEISGRLEADKFKQMASGEPIEARLPYGQPMCLTNYARLAFNCNELPNDIEHTEAYFRRYIILPFDVTIPPEERDPNLANSIIESELSGVFNWVLAGLQRLLEQNGFSQSDAVDQMLESFRRESDSAAMFIDDENYRKSDSNFMYRTSLYPTYKAWCMENGYRAFNSKNFMKRLEALGFSTGKKTAGKVIYIEK